MEDNKETKDIKDVKDVKDANDAKENRDRIHIADDVIAAIAVLAAAKEPGVTLVSVSGDGGGGIAGLWGKRSPNRGVRVSGGEAGIEVELFCTVEYGVKIGEAAKRLQDGIRNDIEQMTGLKTQQVTVHVVGVNNPAASDGAAPAGSTASTAPVNAESGGAGE